MNDKAQQALQQYREKVANGEIIKESKTPKQKWEDDSGKALYCKVFSKECSPANNEWVVWTGTRFYY